MLTQIKKIQLRVLFCVKLLNTLLYQYLKDVKNYTRLILYMELDMVHNHIFNCTKKNKNLQITSQSLQSLY